MAISFIRISGLSSPTLSCFGSPGASVPRQRGRGRRWFRTVLQGIREDIDPIMIFSPYPCMQRWGVNESFGMTSW